MSIEHTIMTVTEAEESLPDDYASRAARRGDLAPVINLINTCSMADVGTPAQNEAELLKDWDMPGLDLNRDSRVVIAPDGPIIGYAELWNLGDPPVRPFVYLIVHPGYRNDGIERYLLRWGEARAAEYIPSVPPDGRFSLRGGVNSKRSDLKAIYESEGYTFVRAFLRMRIDMDQAPPTPVWPEGIAVRTLRNSDDDLYAAFLANEDAFQDHWGYMPVSFDKARHWIENDPDFDRTLYFLAVTDDPDGEEIVGTCFCRPKTTEDPGMAWVADLGVRRQWRRRGIAQALLNHCFGEFWQRGQRKVGLGVDASSLTGATRLYEKVGMRVYRRFDSYAKELRPGVEFSTQDIDD